MPDGPQGGQQDGHPGAIKDDEAHDAAPQKRVLGRDGGQQDRLTNYADDLHDQRLPQGYLEPDRVQQGKDIGHLPHEEQDAVAGHGRAARNALQLEGRCEGGGVEHELHGGLQVPEQDDGD